MVLVRDRKLSSLQFYINARDLRKTVAITLVNRVDKNEEISDHLKSKTANSLLRTVFLINQKIVNAYAVNPTIESEYEMRRLLQDEAIAHTEYLYDLIEFLADLRILDTDEAIRHAESVTNLIQLLRNWKHSDNKIKKNLDK